MAFDGNDSGVWIGRLRLDTYRIAHTWSEKGLNGQMMAFAEVAVKTKYEGEWGRFTVSVAQ